MPRVMTCTNTKAGLTAAQTRRWLDEVILACATDLAQAGFFACLPDPLIPEAVAVLRGSGVEVGAQDCWYEMGPATGETPAELLGELGCTKVMLGHAERRGRGETDDLIARKARAATAAGVQPLICLGETEPEPVDRTAAIATAQFQAATARLPADTPVAVMYEPGWTIGAAAASPELVVEVCETLHYHAEIRGLGPLSILYGGGVVPGTYTALVSAGARIAGLGLGRVVQQPALLREVLDEIHAATSL